MITFNKETNIFHITNKSISLFLYINSEGYIENLYFGKYLESLDLSKRIIEPDSFTTQYYDKNANVEKTFEDKFSNRFSRFELGNHLSGDNRPSPIIIKKSNGMLETVLHYVSHRIYKGFPDIAEGPHVRGNNGETLEILLKDEFADIYVKYNVSISLNSDILVKNFEIINKDKTSANLLRAMSMQLDLNRRDMNVHHFYGSWASERNEAVNAIVDGEQQIYSTFGKSSYYENPFVYLSNFDTTFDHGFSLGFNIIYSGNFKFSIFSDYTKNTRITYGINDFDFDWLLEPGSSFITPQVVISYSENGIDEMSHNFHKFISNNLLNQKYFCLQKPVLYNSWEGCTFNFTTASIKSYIDDSLKIGSELFVLDDGWFGHRNDDHSSLGDWYENSSKINLKEVEEYAHSKGMKFGLWFEPEMISFDSDLFKKHPEYAFGIQRNHPTLHRSQFILNFTNDEVIDNIYSQMCKILDRVNIDYIKWDMNRDLNEHFASNLDASKQGEVLHKYVLGYYKLIDKILKRYPNIMIEGCSAGGGRFDLGTLYYCPQIWGSDNSRPSARSIINFNTSLAYPLKCIGTHVNNSDELPYKDKAYLALFGTYGFEMNPNTLKDDEIKGLSEVSEIYKQYHKDVFDEGELYHLSSIECFPLMAMQVVSKDKLHSFVVCYSKENVNESIKLQGLDKKSSYLVNGAEITGESLLNEGVNVKLSNSLSFITIIRK